MPVNRVDSLTSNDVSQLEAQYGQDYQAAINDLTNNTVPSHISEEDALAWVLEMVGSSDLDPDDPSLAYLWQDPDVIDMLEEFYFKNSAESDIALLIEDIEAYMAAGGLDISSQGIADIFINEYKEEFGELYGSGNGISEGELTDLVSFVKQFNPGLYLIIKGMELGGEVEEALEDIFDEMEDLYDDLNDMIDDVGDFDVDENNKAQQLQLEIQQVQAAIQAYQDIGEQMIDIVSQTIRTGDEWWSTHAQTNSAILSN